eukprot:3750961-Prymnesium_polylepis.1
MLSHNGRMQPPAQPGLVARLGLAPRLELLRSARPHLHGHQAIVSHPHRRRLEQVWTELRCLPRPAGLRPRRVAPMHCSSVDSDQVEFMGEKKRRAERDAELRREAVSLDDGDSED